MNAARPLTPPLRTAAPTTLAAILAVLAAGSLFGSGCASAPRVAMEDPATLRAERDEWRGDRSGSVLLRRHVRTVVDTARSPTSATAHTTVHLTLARYAGAPAAETVRFDAPPGADLTGIRARIITAGGITPTRTTAERRLNGEGSVDPGRVAFELDFAPLTGDALLEVVAELDVPGTLTNDARFLGVPDRPTGEVLLSWDVPSDAEGRIGLVGADHRTVATEADGRRVYALFAKGLPPRGEARAYARFTLIAASPSGYDQAYAATWREASAAYVAGLVAPSAGLRGDYAAPFTPDDADLADRVRRAYVWVRDRIQRPDALEAPWDAARPLIGPVQDNDLTATDKVHLLHWLLDAASVEHRLAVARGARWPALDPAAPATAVFDAALVYVPALRQWLDPACRACEPGAVRPGLRGGQALALPAETPPVELP